MQALVSARAVTTTWGGRGSSPIFVGRTNARLDERCVQSRAGARAVILGGMTSRVGPKGQVVIPKPLRQRFRVEPGDEVDFVATDEGVLVVPVSEAASLKGALRGVELVHDLEAEHRREVADDR